MASLDSEIEKLREIMTHNIFLLLVQCLCIFSPTLDNRFRTTEELMMDIIYDNDTVLEPPHNYDCEGLPDTGRVRAIMLELDVLLGGLDVGHDFSK